MAQKKTLSIQAETAREYRRKYPDYEVWGDSKLARLMFAETNGMWDNKDSARDSLRNISGKHGEKKKRYVRDKSFIVEEKRSSANVMPESWAKVKPVFKLPVACNKIGFMADFQIPFHDNGAIKTFVEWLKLKKINTLFINSDFIDFYGISEFIKDPRFRNTSEERDAAVAMLAWLRYQFPTQTIYYNLSGNHEKRWEKWKFKHPEVMGMPEFELETILQLNKYNVIPLKNHKHILIGKLRVLHGDTIFGKWGSGVAKARTVFLKANVGTIVSHVHVTNEFTKKDLDGKMITCWTTGCFMNIDDVEYAPHNEYNHGGAYIETNEKGDYWVENKRIENGRIW